MPGTIPNIINKPDRTPKILGSENISLSMSFDKDSSLPVARETIKPVAVEINNAGI